MVNLFLSSPTWAFNLIIDYAHLPYYLVWLSPLKLAPDGSSTNTWSSTSKLFLPFWVISVISHVCMCVISGCVNELDE